LIEPISPTKPNPDLLMDELRQFFRLPESLRPLQAKLAHLEKELAADGRTVEAFGFDQEDTDHLFQLAKRQWLEPEGKVRHLAPLRWLYTIVRRLFLGTQRKYNESNTHLIQRLSSMALLLRYSELRSLALEKRLDELQRRVAQLESRANRPSAASSFRPPEPKP
jgi:hypothetical protein